MSKGNNKMAGVGVLQEALDVESMRNKLAARGDVTITQPSGVFCATLSTAPNTYKPDWWADVI